jgi:hypothetical protein
MVSAARDPGEEHLGSLRRVKTAFHHRDTGSQRIKQTRRFLCDFVVIDF